MTGEQRLALALEMHELSCDVAREGIRHQHPGITDAEVEQLLRQRLELDPEVIERKALLERLRRLGGSLALPNRDGRI